MQALRARQPKRLLQTDPFVALPPEDLTPTTLAELASNEVMTNPGKVLQVYKEHLKGCGTAELSVLLRAFVQLGFLFDPNSFFAAADRQFITAHKDFRCLAHDIAAKRAELPPAAAPVLLYAMACLEYRCAPLLVTMLDAVEANLHRWRLEALTLLLHSTASLGLASVGGEPVRFDLGQGDESRDYGHICELLGQELRQRLAVEPSDEYEPEASLHDWSRAAFALSMAGLYEAPGGASGSFLLAELIARACSMIQSPSELDSSGWAQFFLYQTLYCVDVEQPASEEAVKRAMPMWVQERLHRRWLDEIILHAQPQGADTLQRDVDAALRRTNTQAMLNCSCGRDWDEQHCWFAGFLLKPKVALECDSMLPLGPGRPRPSGWLALKSRVLKKMGYTVVTMHRSFWDQLTEDQKDEQILRMRASVGYEHDRDLAQRLKRVRQAPVQKGRRFGRRPTWKPEPPPV